MTHGNDHKKTADAPAAHTALRELAAHTASYAARAKVADTIPHVAGESYLYEVRAGWESDLLRRDSETLTVRNSFELEQAFFVPGVHAIYVPQDASLTRQTIKQICSRHGQGKTVFYEVNKDE